MNQKNFRPEFPSPELISLHTKRAIRRLPQALIALRAEIARKDFAAWIGAVVRNAADMGTSPKYPLMVTDGPYRAEHAACLDGMYRLACMGRIVHTLGESLGAEVSDLGEALFGSSNEASRLLYLQDDDMVRRNPHWQTLDSFASGEDVSVVSVVRRTVEDMKTRKSGLTVLEFQARQSLQIIDAWRSRVQHVFEVASSASLGGEMASSAPKAGLEKQVRELEMSCMLFSISTTFDLEVALTTEFAAAQVNSRAWEEPAQVARFLRLDEAARTAFSRQLAADLGKGLRTRGFDFSACVARALENPAKVAVEGIYAASSSSRSSRSGPAHPETVWDLR